MGMWGEGGPLEGHPDFDEWSEAWAPPKRSYKVCVGGAAPMLGMLLLRHAMPHTPAPLPLAPPHHCPSLCHATSLAPPHLFTL